MVLMSVVEVVPTSDVSEAFKDIDVAILVGAMPRREGMERKDLLKANVKIFKQQGEALSQHAKKTCKVNLVAKLYQHLLSTVFYLLSVLLNATLRTVQFVLA